MLAYQTGIFEGDARPPADSLIAAPAAGARPPMIPPMGSARGGFVLVLLASTCFGTLGIFSSLAYDEGADPWTLLFLRFAITSPLLVLLALALREPWPGRRGIVLGLLLGILQIGVGVGLLEGFERAPVALVTLLYFAYPLITSVGAALVYRERISPQRESSSRSR